MKKWLSLGLSVVILFMMTACAKHGTTTDNARWYGFSGENEKLSITNGKILISDLREELSGGTMKEKEGLSATGCTVTFYINRDDGKEVLMSNSTIAQNGGSLVIEGDAGKLLGGPGAILKNGISEQDLIDHLYVEFELVDQDGSTEVFEFKLDVQPIELSAS